MLAALVAAALLFTSSGPAAQDAPGGLPPYNYAADLRARHPEINRHPEFKSWFDGVRVGPWYETEADAQRRRTVVIQDTPGRKVFAAQVTAGEASTVGYFAKVDLEAMRLTRATAIAATSAKWSAESINGTRPVVEFDSAGKWTFSWEVDVLMDSAIQTYRLQDDKATFQFKSSRARSQSIGRAPAGVTSGRRGARGGKAMPSPPMAAPPSLTPPPKWLRSDELHHLGAFVKEAAKWTANLTTRQQMAFRIFEHVRDGYTYDATIKDIGRFTWSDSLTDGLNRRRGVCDEISVVAVTYLRSLGIPARLEIISWYESGDPNSQQHEALEYEDDNGKWQHLDATWKAFNTPSFYKSQPGVSNVTVMYADDPLDSRSTTDAWGVKDPTGDGKLHPYNDFVLSDPFPGKPKSGYSH